MWFDSDFGYAEAKLLIMLCYLIIGVGAQARVSERSGARPGAPALLALFEDAHARLLPCLRLLRVARLAHQLPRL